MAIRRYEKIPGTTKSRIVRGPSPPSAPSRTGGGGGGAPAPKPALSETEKAYAEEELKRTGKASSSLAQRYVEQQPEGAYRATQVYEELQKTEAERKAEESRVKLVSKITTPPIGYRPRQEPPFMVEYGAREMFRGEVVPERMVPGIETYAERQTAVFIPEEKKPSRIITTYRKAEAKVSPYAKKVIPEKPVAGLKVFGFAGYTAAKFFPKAQERALWHEAGMLKEWREKPVKTVTMGAAFFALPGALTGVGAIGKASYFAGIPGLAKVAPYVGKAAAVGLPILYAGVSAFRISKEPTEKAKWEKAGRITGGELIPMLVGGYAGAKFWPKAIGLYRTIGRKYIPVEQLAPKDVLAGKQAIWTAPKGKHLPLFKKGKPYVYHATDTEWAQKLVVQVGAGKRELPGLYVAPKTAIHFLRIQKPTLGLYGKAFFPKGVTPAIMKIKTPKVKVTLAGRVTPYKIGKQEFYYAWTKPAKPGMPHIPLIKSEIEAVFPLKTHLGHVRGEYYTKVAGVRVPIEEYIAFDYPQQLTLIGKGQIPTVTSPSYYPSTPTYVTTPASYAAALGITYKPAAYKPAYKAPSIVEPYKISKPSAYKPSKIKGPTSYIIYEKPSEITITPPYKPSTYKPPGAPPYTLPVTPPSKPPTYKPPSYKPPSYPPYKPPTYKPPGAPPSKPPIAAFLKPRPGKRYVPGFDVLVRIKGKWAKISRESLEKLSALSLGARYTARTPAATFRIKPTERMARLRKRKDIFFLLRAAQYYKKKAMVGDLFIEKTKFRIDTGGELAGITHKGLQAQKARGKGGFNLKKLWGK